MLGTEGELAEVTDRALPRSTCMLGNGKNNNGNKVFNAIYHKKLDIPIATKKIFDKTPTFIPGKSPWQAINRRQFPCQGKGGSAEILQLTRMMIKY